MDVYKVPKYFIIHLKRFKGQGPNAEKNTIKVNFPLVNFDMSINVLNKK